MEFKNNIDLKELGLLHDFNNINVFEKDLIDTLNRIIKFAHHKGEALSFLSEIHNDEIKYNSCVSKSMWTDGTISLIDSLMYDVFYEAINNRYIASIGNFVIITEKIDKSPDKKKPFLSMYITIVLPIKYSEEVNE